VLKVISGQVPRGTKGREEDKFRERSRQDSQTLTARKGGGGFVGSSLGLKVLREGGHCHRDLYLIAEKRPDK